MEEWRIIPEFPEYEASNLGHIRSWRKPFHIIQGKRKRGWRGAPLPKVIPGTIGTGGYVAVILRRPGSQKPIRRTIHKLVAAAFLGPAPSPDHTDIAHLNGKPADNRLENLAWATRYENVMMMAEHGTMQYGEKSCTSVLTEAQVAQIRAAHAECGRGSGIQLAAQFGVSKQQISRIVRGQRWRHTMA